MHVRMFPVVARDIEEKPDGLKKDIYGAFQKLESGETIPMPLCRPLFSIMRGLYELRFSCVAGEYRVFYYIKAKDAIYVIHAAQKKRQSMDRKTIELLKARIRNL